MNKKTLHGLFKGTALLCIIATLLLMLGCVNQMAPELEIADPSGFTLSTEATEPSKDPTDATELSKDPTDATEPSKEPTEESSGAPSTEPTVAPTTPPTDATIPSGSSFAVHFIDVGQADAALILCDGQAMLIDGGNSADSNLMYAYLQKHNITHLDYLIATHAHEDHVGGLAGALNYATVSTVYCPTTTYNTKAFRSFVSALVKRDTPITIPTVGQTFHLGSATCTILAVNTDNADVNNTSIVLRIVYGETSFLFTGDAEREVEQKLLDSGVDLSATVLKVGHHGSRSSTSYVFLREIMPEYAVICVGKDNDYGHPTSDVLSRLRDADVTTFRTDMQGDILCVSDGKTVTFTVSKNANADVFGNLD